MNTYRLIRRLAIPFSFAALLLGAFALGLSPRALAGDHDDHVEARALLQRGEILPLSRILAIVQQHVPGDAIEVELEHGKHGWEYEVKVLTAAGQVRKVKLSARTGTVRKIKDD
ncbi:PepSY domain-containing protein [Rhodanobacter ginsenosidimutans]|uniref:PepSY domain-containing protein n=1 Tax=Rhodanobacter ginsenosidimutans TaxID=490571 RepID=A0ABW0JTH4_9GAMM